MLDEFILDVLVLFHLNNAKDVIQTNWSSYLFLTQSLIKILVNRKNRSGIINIGSISGLSPNPYKGGY